MAIVALRSATESDCLNAVGSIFKALGWLDAIPCGGKVVIKPNLCCEIVEKIPHSNTEPALVDAVVTCVKERTSEISIVESDGFRYSAELVFERTGLYEIGKRHGVQVINLSKDEQREIEHPLLSGFPLPCRVLDADVLINMPCLKTHALTVFTGAIKNLWGCVPRYDRILLHKHLDRLLCDLAGIFRPTINLMDGILACEGRGPTNGTPRRLNLILGSSDPVALDATAMRLVGLDPQTARHIVLTAANGYGQIDEESIQLDGDFDAHRVQFEPAHLDWAVDWMNRLTRFRFFTYHILHNDNIFYPVKALVQVLRRVAIVR